MLNLNRKIRRFIDYFNEYREENLVINLIFILNSIMLFITWLLLFRDITLIVAIINSITVYGFLGLLFTFSKEYEQYLNDDLNDN